MIKRSIENYLVKDAQYYPCVTLTGPRQSGKTTLVRNAFPDHDYVSLEEPELRMLAKDDPRGFLMQYSGDVIFDEVQRVPDLLSYIQGEVDRDERPGRFILTGSENVLLMERVSQSLAGRSAVLHLLPFSRSELDQDAREATDVPDLFQNDRSAFKCWDLIYSGLYPRIYDKKIPPHIWLSDYLRTYVERDVRRLVNLGDVETFERFLALCAGRTGQILNYSSLASDCGIAVDTAKRWISILKTCFIVYLVRPHYRNFNKRLIKSPKLYFYDTGLASRLLGLKSSDQLFTHPLRGHLFENYIISEVCKRFFHNRQEPPISFWRDQQGHEVDLIIEEAGKLFPVEIKSGATLNPSMLKGLQDWCRIAKQPIENATLIYGGQDNLTHKGVNVRPWFSV